MDRIEIDEYMVDVQTLLTSLGVARSLPEHIRRSIPKGRRWVCVAMDAATRVVLGLVVAENPSAAVAVKLLRMIVTDKTAIARAIGAESGWDFHGGLGVVATDAGTAFRSDAFQAAVHALHGRLEYGPVRVPEMRGTVERFFGSLSRSLMPRLSGRTFSNPVEKGDYDTDARTVLDDDDLLRILLIWVIDFYHNSPHAGLGGQTPAGRWRQLAAERFVPEPPDRHTLRTATGIELIRRISKQGLRLFANHYSCEAVHEHYRGRRGRSLTVRVDPDDIGEISVRIDKLWHRARCVDQDLDGISLEAWKDSCVRLRQAHRNEAEVSREVRDNALREIRSIVDRKAALLLPSSLDPSQKTIERLEKTLFHGLSFAPAPDIGTMLDSPTAFGMPVVPAKPAKPARDSVKRPPRTDAPGGDAGRSDQAKPVWRLEDE